MNDFTTAAKWFQKAVNSSPGDLRLLASLADAQLRAGNRDAARETIARGLEKDPTNPQLLNLKLKSERSKPD
jgi:Flp pilus assembly protein TadD